MLVSYFVENKVAYTQKINSNFSSIFKTLPRTMLTKSCHKYCYKEEQFFCCTYVYNYYRLLV